MNQPQAILKNTVVLGLAQIIERISTVYISILVARRLGVGALGVYSVAMVYYGLLFMAAELGSTTYLVREIAKEPGQTSKYAVHTAIMGGLLGAVLAVIVRLVLPYLGFSRDVERALSVIVWAIVPACWKAIQEAIFIAYQRAEFLTLFALIAAVSYLGASLYLLWHGGDVVSLVFAFTVVQFVLMPLYFAWTTRYITKLHWEFVPAFAFKLLRDIRPFTGSSLIQGFLSRPEVILLSFTKNDAQIGLYSAALKIIDLWQLIPSSFMTSVFPVLTSYCHTAGGEKILIVREKSIKYLLAVSLPIAAGLFVTARPVVQRLYGTGFESSVAVLRVLVLTIPLVSLWAVLWRVLSARGEHGAAFRSQVASLLVRFALGYVMIRSFTSVGAAISATAGTLVLDLLLAYQVRRDGSRLRILRLAGRSALATASMVVVTLLLRDHLQLWVVVSVSATAYIMMMLLLRTFSEDDFSLFRSVWRVEST